jgi:guanine deaminase
VGPSLFDVPFARAVPFADEELPGSHLAAPPRPGVDSQVGAFRTFAMGLRERGGLVQAIGTPSAPQRCSPALLDAVRLLADELGLPVMTHVLETRVQAVGAQRDYGQSMIAYLDQRGFLRPGTSLIHGVWLTRADMEVIAASGASVQHNVWSNLKLGSGLARLRAMLDAGVNVSLGSDGCGSIETVSLLPTMAAAALLSGLRGGPEHAVSASEVFHAATTGGARALGLEAQVGKIAIGHRADIVLYRLDRAPFVPLNDAVRQLVYGMPAAGVDTVIVDGRVVVREGRLLTLDEEDLYRRMIEIQTRMRSGIEEAERQATLLRPGMASIRCRCARIGLGELDSVSSGFLP